MERFLPETNVMVAALSDWHIHHDRAFAEVNRRLSLHAPLILAAHTLVEAYSVLSRLPRPRRLSPAQAWQQLTASFVSQAAALVTLDAEEYRQLLGTSSAAGIAGGRIYDALIMACAVAGAADVLLTFNQRHFESLAGGRVRVVVPA